MEGHLSYTQRMQVRFLQLRSCFSGWAEAQLFRNQQAVGSNPTGSFLQVSRNWQRIALPGRIYGFESRYLLFLSVWCNGQHICLPSR